MNDWELGVNENIQDFSGRIYELEKKYTKVDKDLWEFIKKVNDLEKDLEDHRETQMINLRTITDKLKNRKVVEVDLHRQIEQLEQKMQIYEGATINYNHDYDRIRQVRVVLKELLYFLGNKDVNWSYKDPTSIKDDMKALIEKLDGPSPVMDNHVKEPTVDYKKELNKQESKIDLTEYIGFVDRYDTRENDHSELISLLQCKIWCNDRKKELISEFVEDLIYIGLNRDRLNRIRKKWEERLK